MKNLISYIPQFKKHRILVLGDVMVDKFIWGKVSRISPEAPVPVVEITKETYALGGAGNVANNLISLGAAVTMIGVTGDDTTGERLMADLSARKICVDGIIRDSERPTIVKTRIIASHQQVVRVDKEVKGEFSGKILNEMLHKLDAIVPEVQAIIISDYGKGVINASVLKRAILLAHRYKIPITVDPKIEHFLRYKNVSCITPNMSEAIAGMRSTDLNNEQDVYNLGRKILKRLRSHSVLITRGEKGMTLFEPGDKITHIPTRAKEVFDVTGAGDTVIATFTLALATHASFVEAAEISNFAAGIVVGKLGTATTSTDELRSAILNFKSNR